MFQETIFDLDVFRAVICIGQSCCACGVMFGIFLAISLLLLLLLLLLLFLLLLLLLMIITVFY